jgi:xylan 1,4-beta-xylosidase
MTIIRIKARLTALTAFAVSIFASTAAAEAPPVVVSIDWAHILRAIPREAYSLNAFQAFNPDSAANPAWRENIAHINPGSIRYHTSGIISDSRTSEKGWLNHETRAWDIEKIRRATAHWPRTAAAQITIHSWPAWMTSTPEKLLDEEQYDAYAALCADLVRIINTGLGLGVRRWEPMNERELAYVRALTRNDKPPQYDKVIEIWNRCARAMKQADPAIQVGGPAISSAARVDLIRQFIRGTRDNLDFFSCHEYSTNDPSLPDETIFDSASNFGPKITRIQKILKQEIPGRPIDIVLNEFNINWTWHSKDPRMIDHKGAVFDALAMTSVLNHGGTATYAWNDVDNIYGKMSRAWKLRPSAHVYHHLNASFIGDSVSVTTADGKKVVPFAVIRKDGGRALMLVNRSAASLDVRIGSVKRIQRDDSVAPSRAMFRRAEISADGYKTTPLSTDSAGLPDAGQLVLSPVSVTFIIEEIATPEP